MTQQQSNSIDEKNNSALFQNRNQESDFIAQMFPIFDSKDKKLTEFLYHNSNLQKIRWIWQILSFLGDPRIWLFVFLFFGVYGLYIKDLTYITLFFTGFFQSFVIYYIIKNLIKRHRPFKQNETIIRLDSTGHGYSFPSGHCHHSTILYGLIALIWLPFWSIPLFFILNLLIAISRIMLGCHFVSDTIMGIIEAYIELIIFWWVTKIFYLNILYVIQSIIF
ncbi:MAG: phosphatase PAP2 family protein [Candidatus Lokiarchaeota archaeon]|nr:phosphatase PAP2 family protein [Candidatus Harpocratesius repetitus]